jgi:peptide/nickel transport system substrate-binding protein/oligopeptide transport system substrate-binding protein
MTKGSRLLLSIVLLAALAAARPAALPQESAPDITVAFSSTDISFNPLHTFTATEAQIYTALFEGLVSYHPLTMEPLPAAAARWEVSEDKTRYRFFLRETGRYWNGDPVTSFDFRSSWLRLLDPEAKSEYSFLLDMIRNAKAYRTGEIDDPAEVGIYAVSPYVLDVQLEYPAGHFLKVLCHHSCVPVHPKFLEKRVWNDTNIIPGNGAFYVYSQNESEMLLIKNSLYWDAKSIRTESIRILLHETAADSTASFNDKESQWVADGFIFSEIEEPEGIVTNPLFATNYFYFSCREEPWSNPDVRRALALIVPWDRIRSPQFMYIPSERLVPALPSYPQIEGIGARQTDEALILLEKAGYPNGEGLPEITIKIPAGFESRRIALMMKQGWEEALDVTVTVREYDFSDYYNELKGSDYTLGTISWIGDFPDPLTFLQMWTESSNLNDAGYSNDEFEELIDRSMLESGKERYATLAQAEEKLLQDAVVLPINHLPAWNLIDLSELEGWYPNPLDIHPFKYIRLRKLEVGPWIVRGNDRIFRY